MAEQMTQLPTVAKSFYAFCKKCDADRYHVVLAHTTATSAKLKCEVCASIKSWSLPKAQEKKMAVGSKAAGSKGTKVPSARTVAARQSAYVTSYESLLKTYESKAGHTYSIKTKFDMNHKIDHPKFGLGIVTAVFTDKVEVAFSDESRFLMHNRA
jgi:hypothetical protein